MFDTNPNNYYNYNSQQQQHVNNQPLHLLYKEGTVVKINNEFYYLIRRIRKNEFLNMDDVKRYNAHLHTNSIKQHGEFYLFLKEIPTIEFEEIDADIA